MIKSNLVIKELKVNTHKPCDLLSTTTHTEISVYSETQMIEMKPLLFIVK